MLLVRQALAPQSALNLINTACQFFTHHYVSKVQQTCLFRSSPVSSVRTTVATQGAIKNPSHGGRLEAILDWMSCELPPMSPKSFSLLICEIYDQFFWSRSQKQIWSTRGTSSRNLQPRTHNQLQLFCFTGFHDLVKDRHKLRAWLTIAVMVDNIQATVLLSTQP